MLGHVAGLLKLTTFVIVASAPPSPLYCNLLCVLYYISVYILPWLLIFGLQMLEITIDLKNRAQRP